MGGGLSFRVDRGLRGRHGKRRKGTNRAKVPPHPCPLQKTPTQASTTTQTQEASTCASPTLPCARSGPGPEVSGQSQPRTLGEPEGESGSRSPPPGLRRPAMLKFPIDWRTRCYSGTGWQRRRAGNREDRTCSHLGPGVWGWEAQEQFPHLETQCTYCPSSLLLAHIPTAKAITAGARETF